MAKWDLSALQTRRDAGEELTKRERIALFQKDQDDLGFNKKLHGDQVIVTLGEDDKIHIKVKLQTSFDTSRNIGMTFDTQSQVERLFVPIMKGMNQ